MVKQQPDVKQLDLLPGVFVEVPGVEFIAQAFDAFVDTVVVKADAFLDGLVHPEPVALFEAFLGLFAGFTKQLVVLVEALDCRQRNLVGIGAVKADGYFHCAEPEAMESANFSTC